MLSGCVSAIELEKKSSGSRNKPERIVCDPSGMINEPSDRLPDDESWRAKLDDLGRVGKLQCSLLVTHDAVFSALRPSESEGHRQPLSYLKSAS